MRAHSLVLVLVATTLVAGCGTVETMSGRTATSYFDVESKHVCDKAKDECDVDVGWLTGRVPEDIVAAAGKRTKLSWTIPAATLIWFDTPGIVFDAKAADEIDCKDRNNNPKAKGKVVECVNNGKENPKEGYKYTVRLLWLGLPVSYDPFVWNR